VLALQRHILQISGYQQIGILKRYLLGPAETAPCSQSLSLGLGPILNTDRDCQESLSCRLYGRARGVKDIGSCASEDGFILSIVDSSRGLGRWLYIQCISASASGYRPNTFHMHTYLKLWNFNNNWSISPLSGNIIIAEIKGPITAWLESSHSLR